MTQLSHGFYLERIAVVGPGVDTAEVEFRDGLNVVAGASDTGKSYLCSLVDFVFGASSPPRVIEQAKRYARVVARLRDRRSGGLHEIERALIGGDATVRCLDSHGAVLDERVAGAKHSAEDATTLSALLLGLSGFGPVRVRKNKKGEARTLSFRDIAFLAVVDETRIISENPPHLSGSPVESTVEGEVFRFLVTGIQSVEPVVAPRKTTAQSAKAQLELVLQLITQVEGELAALQLGSLSVDEELTRLDQTRANLLNDYESSRVELVDLERELATRSRVLREAESRLVVVEGLTRRFELLDRHYESDIERLSAVEEAGSMLEALPASACPVCGAAPEEHRPDQAAEHFRVEDVRQAAITERDKIGRLRADLQRALSELNQESTELENRRTTIRAETKQIQGRVADEVQPRVRTSAEQLQMQNARRDVLLRGRVLTEQLRDLEGRAGRLEAQGKRGKGSAPVVESGPTTAGMEAFAQQVQEILSAWHFPETGRVVFSEESPDLVVGGQPRVSHGKGVRALSCSAFIAGLMRHCLQRGLAHPGLIVLDSPLVAYKDPDSSAGTESARIRQAGVKDAFYGALADGLCLGQVIVLENEDPPPDVAQRVIHHHFTKRPTGRYGLFPVGR
jgi:hypothetical protein